MTREGQELIDYHNNRLRAGEIYFDRRHDENVEFCYMGKTGLAIVCEPGDSGGGMQSCWGIEPESLEDLLDEK